MKYINLIIILFLISCHNRSKNDIKLDTPKEGEWLYEHKEKGQTFEQYKKGNPVRPLPGKNIIYLMPVGEFTPSQEKILNLTRDYVAIFFQQKTILLKPVSDKTVPGRNRDNNIQLLAPYILDTLLKDKTPKDGIALMAISEKDLYPKEDWNYVFGLASYTRRVGVTSIYRLENKQFTICLRRLINISSHEIGHMMSMNHCTFAKCTMNGSNSLSETDASPNRLCSECQQKLSWNLKYNDKQRLKQLLDFFQSNNLQRDYILLKQDE